MSQTIAAEPFVARAALDAFSMLSLIHNHLDSAFLATLLSTMAGNATKVCRYHTMPYT